MRRIIFGTLIGLLTGMSTAVAQSPLEFESKFYNASQCLQHEETKQDGVRVILAKNFCQKTIAALVCFRIINAEGIFSRRGWYCDYSTLYSPNLLRTVSRGGFYHPRRRVAACTADNQRCNQVLRSVEVRVNSSHGDPETAAIAIRDQLGFRG